MSERFEPRRILLLSSQRAPTLALLSQSSVADWEIIPAAGSAAAALLLQSNGCHVVLADQSHYDQEGSDGLAWLVQKETAPVVLLADADASAIRSAYERGLSLWLPLEQVRQCPELLAGALQRVVRWHDLHRRQVRTHDALDESQRQVDRLVGLLWRTAPMHVEKRWYTHRHMLERLEEELARAERYQLPLTVALGEVATEQQPAPQRSDMDFLSWTADEVARGKRRSDVAGQYGLHGFMLLMTHTHGEGGVTCCRRIQQHLEQANRETGPREQVKAYFGVATFAAGAISAQALLRRAEEHLESAKHDPRERVVAG